MADSNVVTVEYREDGFYYVLVDGKEVIKTVRYEDIEGLDEKT